MDQLPSPNEPLSEGRDTDEHHPKITVEVTAAQPIDVDTSWTVPAIGREIPYDQLLPPLLSQNDDQGSPTVKHQQHRWVKGKYFYSLPSELWQEINGFLPDGRIDARDRQVETDFAESCGDHSAWVGVWNNSRVQYTGLRSPASSSPRWDLRDYLDEGQSEDELITSLGWDLPPHNLNWAKVENSFRVADERLASPFMQALSAYPGWLLTNKTFIEEQRNLVQELREEIRNLGTHLFCLGESGISPYLESVNNGRFDLTRTMARFQEFLARWRLSRLAGPDLPEPLGPLMSGQILPAMMQHLAEAGGLFFLPDTIPRPSRDELREMLSECLHQKADQTHLTDWKSLIANDRSDRGPLRKFQRIFQLQHYWRLLHGRHPQIFEGNLSRLRQILGTFLKVGEATIKNDLKEIEERLDNGWETRQLPLE